MLRRKHGENHGQAVRKVADAAALLTMRDEVSKVFVHEELYDYIVRLARATREHKSIRQGASPRCSVAAMALAQACSWMGGIMWCRRTSEQFTRIAQRTACY